MGLLWCGDHRVDETSQIMLRVLKDRLDSVTTGELREAAGMDHNQQIRYRFEEHLIPAGLAAESGVQESPGKGPESSSWEITEKGKEWVDEHVQEVADAVDASRLVESFRRTQDTVERLQGRVDGFSEEVAEVHDVVDSQGDRIHRIEGKVDRAIQASDDASNRSLDAEQKVNGQDEKINDLGEQLSELQEELDGVVDDLEEARRSHQQNLVACKNEIEKLDERTREIRRRQEMSLIDRVKAYLSTSADFK